MKTKVTKDLEHNTLIIERTFDTTKENLWKYYAEKELFEQWWGPEGWTTTTKEFNFTPGGRVHYFMKCVDKNQGEWFGKESWAFMTFEKIDAPNSFTAQDYFSNPEGTIAEGMPTQKFEVELVEENGKVNLITRSLTKSVKELEDLLRMGMAEGFDSQLNKLEKILAAA